MIKCFLSKPRLKERISMYHALNPTRAAKENIVAQYMMDF